MEEEEQKLIILAKQGNEEAMNMLLFKYDTFLNLLCITYLKNQKYLRIEFAELKNIARISMFTSLKYYDYTKSDLRTFLNLTITQDIRKYIASCVKRYTQMKASIFFEDNPYSDDSITYEEIISDESTSVKKWQDDNEQFEKFCEIEEKYISKREKDIMLLRASGYRHGEIVEKLNITKSNADSAIRKMKRIAKNKKK